MTGIKWAEFIQRGQTVVDVGANVGSYTKAFVDAVGPTGTVIAFEPDPEVAGRCQKSWPTADVRMQAVSNRCGVTTLYKAQHSAQSSRWKANIDKPSGRVTVPMVSLDCVLKGRTVHGIKIDAQGDDGQIIVGAVETLAKMPAGSWLLFEVWPAGLKAAGFSVMDLVDRLAGWDVVARGKAYEATTKTLSEILTTASDWTGGRHTNVLMRKRN